MKLSWLIIAITSVYSFCAEVSAQDSELAGLHQAYWTAESALEQQQIGRQLAAAAGSVGNLYQQLKQGPDFASDVARGYIEDVRVSGEGTRFPYVVLIPESYDPARSYPVEFMLHGGVSRSEWESGGGWWRRGYDSLQNPDRITVVPAAWNDAFWWHFNQAQNLPALLREVKRQYNVDDNRVYLTGVSDGGTGVYFFAFKQNTQWAAFMPYIAHPAVLQNPASGGGYQLYFDNLTTKPLYIVNGEDDPLYPASSVQQFIDVLRNADVKHVFKVIEGGGHNTAWLPDETDNIEQFKLNNPRDPFPDTVRWVTDTSQRFNRSHWVQIDQLLEEGEPGMVTAQRDGNVINVTAIYVSELTLLLNPEEVDFSQPIAIYINGTLSSSNIIEQDVDTLLKWAARDLDKAMLVTAELNIKVPQ